MDPAVRCIARDRAAGLLGRGDIEVQVVGQRHDYWVLRCVPAGPRPSVLVKLAGPDCAYPVDFARTAAVIARAADAGMWRYVVQEVAAGREWREVRPRLSATGVATAYAQLADVLVALSSVAFDAFGPLGGDGLPTSDLDLLSALEHRATETIPDRRRVMSTRPRRQRPVPGAKSTPHAKAFCNPRAQPQRLPRVWGLTLRLATQIVLTAGRSSRASTSKRDR